MAVIEIGVTAVYAFVLAFAGSLVPNIGHPNSFKDRKQLIGLLYVYLRADNENSMNSLSITNGNRLRNKGKHQSEDIRFPSSIT